MNYLKCGVFIYLFLFCSAFYSVLHPFVFVFPFLCCCSSYLFRFKFFSSNLLPPHIRDVVLSSYVILSLFSVFFICIILRYHHRF